MNIWPALGKYEWDIRYITADFCAGKFQILVTYGVVCPHFQILEQYLSGPSREGPHLSQPRLTDNNLSSPLLSARPTMPGMSRTKSSSSSSASTSPTALRDLLTSGEKDVLRRVCPRGYGGALDRTLRLLKVKV